MHTPAPGPVPNDSLASRIDVRLGTLADMPALSALWRELESRADGSSFLSWTWIGCWLGSLPPQVEVRVLRAERQGAIVGLALLVIAAAHAPGLARRSTAHLNSTGQARYDGLAIEHNGFLMDRRHAPAAHLALMRFLCEQRHAWRAVYMPGITAAQRVEAQMLPDHVVLRVQERNSPVIHLQAVRDRGGDYLGLLSPRRRAHLRRSMRACEQWGPLSVSVADDPGSAGACFERLLQLHRLRHAALNQGSNFDTPHSLDFHRRLIEVALARGEVQLLRVRAGEHDIGCLYSLVHRGRVSFYQSGYDYQRVDSRFSPGLVTLTLAIEHNARLGLDCFDFLAGDAAYKQTLATDTEPMFWIELHRDGLLLRLQSALQYGVRQARQRVRTLLRNRPDNLGLVLVGLFNDMAHML